MERITGNVPETERGKVSAVSEKCALLLFIWQEFGTIMKLLAGNGCLHLTAHFIFLKLTSGIPCNLGL